MYWSEGGTVVPEKTGWGGDKVGPGIVCSWNPRCCRWDMRAAVSASGWARCRSYWAPCLNEGMAADSGTEGGGELDCVAEAELRATRTIVCQWAMKEAEGGQLGEVKDMAVVAIGECREGRWGQGLEEHIMCDVVELGQGVGMESVDTQEGVHVVIGRDARVHFRELGDEFCDDLTEGKAREQGDADERA